ncbi:MAG: O-acetyl-ADP-ribose deacetylase [Candidatus Margulisbacteria bacterium]|nr:O-acetyl-ADP-ribose deacetylase [Candidatus Margulisiibacteriota bacterium]
MNEVEIGQSKIVFLKGDITKQQVDSIVNAANSSLMGGGGVDGAIHRAGWPAILEECKKIVAKQGRLPTGQAVITTGGKLLAKYVIHTVGPIYKSIRESDDQNWMIRGSENQREQLRSCYIKSLELAAEKGVKSIAFPSISTGAYRYPLSEAALIAVQAVKDFLKQETSIKDVYFVLFNDAAYEAYVEAVRH